MRSEDDIVVVEKDISEDIKKEVDEIVDLSKDIKEEIEDIADEYVQPLECLELTMDEKETGS